VRRSTLQASAGPRLGLWNRLPPHLRQCDSLGHLNGCSRLICLVIETAALCDISVRSAVYKSSYLLTYTVSMYTVSQKNDTDVAHYNFNAHQPILVIFGRDNAERICY